MTGTVKRVVPERGFGFIIGEDGQEYFFHRAALASSVSFATLTPNQRVRFGARFGWPDPPSRGIQA